ncbi:hypothetical protein ACQUY5_16605 [Bacillus cereus]|uniref:hypothetical protein n=1 Tax=Bacillus cereus TaxID=1396 RepID=UPI003D16E7A5
MCDSLAVSYVDEVKDLVSQIEDPITRRACGEFLVKDMVKRLEIAGDRELSTLRKIRRITSWRRYDFGKYACQEQEVCKINRIALKHTVVLLNYLLKFDEVVKNDANLSYSRTVNGFTAQMDISEGGFSLVIKNGEKTLHDVVVGAPHFIHQRDWSKTANEVKNHLDLGLLEFEYGSRSDTFEALYEVDFRVVEPIKTRIRQAFVENGLMTQERGNVQGWTVGNKYGAKIRIQDMYSYKSLCDFELAILIVNQILKEEGYTEVQGKGKIREVPREGW